MNEELFNYVVESYVSRIWEDINRVPEILDYHNELEILKDFVKDAINNGIKVSPIILNLVGAEH
jgi:hypothetical protein